MAWVDRERLHEMTAVVHFHDSSGISHNNRWGPQKSIRELYRNSRS